MAAIWCEVLQLEQVSIHDDFFDLGGHSLLATQAISRMRDAFQVELILNDVFERRTTAKLAELVDMKRLQQVDRRHWKKS